jgi:hypothetical protein
LGIIIKGEFILKDVEEMPVETLEERKMEGGTMKNGRFNKVCEFCIDNNGMGFKVCHESVGNRAVLEEHRK